MAGQAIAEGMRRGMDRWLQFAQMLKGQADETKALRSQLSTLEPTKSESFDKMGNAELKGYATARAIQQEQAAQQQRQQYQNLLADKLQREMNADTQMGQALRDYLGQQERPNAGGAEMNPLSPGQPGAPGPGGEESPRYNPLSPGQPGAPGPEAESPNVSSSARTPTGLAGYFAKYPGAEQSALGRSVISEALKQELGWNLKPTDTVSVAGGRYTQVPTSRDSATVVPNAMPGPDTSKAPKLFDLGGGRQGYWKDDKSFTIVPSKQKTMPSAVSSTLMTMEIQLGNVMSRLGQPNLSKRERADLEADRDRYAGQIDRIKSDWMDENGNTKSVTNPAAEFIWRNGELVPAN